MPLNVTKKLYRNIHTGKLEELTPQRLSAFADQYEEYEQKDTDCLSCGDDVYADETTADKDEVVVAKPTPKVVAEKKEAK